MPAYISTNPVETRGAFASRVLHWTSLGSCMNSPTARIQGSAVIVQHLNIHIGDVPHDLKELSPTSAFASRSPFTPSKRFCPYRKEAIHLSERTFQPLILSHTKPHSMDSTKTFYLASLHHGFVLAQQEDGKPSGVVVTHAEQSNNAHHWIIEHGGVPNVIALKSAANGKYMGCSKVEKYAKVGTVDDKQLWKVSRENVGPPGAFHLDLVDSSGLSLRWCGQDLSKGRRTDVDLRKYDVRCYAICDNSLPLTYQL
jgi:hypothetical protein